ncbi:AlbA family DNA-binding domain-containing protein [Corynebacterium pyruviciproducens]
MYTALHRSLGVKPGRITSEMIDEAIIQKVEESRGLDYKAKPNASGEIRSGDVAKDVAAMANTGGGVIIYGVAEDGEGKPKKRLDVSPIVENEDSYSRSYLQTTTDRIFPPVFGIELYFLGGEGNKVMIVEIPESRDVPHLVEPEKQKGKRFFSVPVRSGASTRFQTEPEIARMYRDRFTNAIDSRHELEGLFDETTELGDQTSVRCVGVGIPRYKSLRPAPTMKEALDIARAAHEGRHRYGYSNASSALSTVYGGARRGLRKWQFSSTTEMTKGALASFIGLHDSGAVQTLRDTRDPYLKSDEVLGDWAEYSILDTVLVAQHQALHTGVGEYDFMFGLVWNDGHEKYLSYETTPGFALLPDPIRFRKYKPITASLNVLAPREEVDELVYTIATDYVNQAGYLHPKFIKEKYVQ